MKTVFARIVPICLLAAVLLPSGDSASAADPLLGEGESTKEPKTVRVLVPPLLGLSRIGRFPPTTGRRDPIPYVADANVGAKRIASVLSQVGLSAEVVSHSDATSRNAAGKAARFAVQVQLLDVSTGGDRKTTTYAAEFRLSLVDVSSGKALAVRKIKGSCDVSVKDRGVGGSQAFYKCLETAASDFAGSDEFTGVVGARKVARGG